MLFWLLVGLGAAIALKPKGPAIGRAAKPPPGMTGKPVKQVITTAARMPEDFPGGSVGGAPVPVTTEGGWSPVWFHVAEGYDLEWGACFFQWSKDLANHGVAGNKVSEWMTGAMGTVMTWIVTVSGLGFIVNRVCFRVLMPALKVHITGALGTLELIGPAVPRGVKRTLADGTVVGVGLNATGGQTIEGWNPSGTSRPGFNAKFGKWPLQWPPPEGKLGGAWLRNLGDIAGVGSDVYQMVTAQDGEEKSWPMMTKAGWRSMFRLGGDFVLVGAVNQKGEVSNRATMDLFDAWKPSGSSGLQKGYATKVKATNRYK